MSLTVSDDLVRAGVTTGEAPCVSWTVVVFSPSPPASAAPPRASSAPPPAAPSKRPGPAKVRVRATTPPYRPGHVERPLRLIKPVLRTRRDDPEGPVERGVAVAHEVRLRGHPQREQPVGPRV